MTRTGFQAAKLTTFANPQDPYFAFGFLIGILKRLCPKYQQKHPSSIKQPKLSPVTNYTARPQQGRSSMDYISAAALQMCCSPKQDPLFCYCADGLPRQLFTHQQGCNCRRDPSSSSYLLKRDSCERKKPNPLQTL